MVETKSINLPDRSSGVGPDLDINVVLEIHSDYPAQEQDERWHMLKG